MGLDTYAVRRMTQEEREAWVTEKNAAGERPRMGGLMVEKISEPLTLDDAPEWTGVPADDFEGIQLIGGMLSGGSGSSSFRGKCYAGFIEAATGFDLYRNVGEYDASIEVPAAAEALKALVDLLDSDNTAQSVFTQKGNEWPDGLELTPAFWEAANAPDGVVMQAEGLSPTELRGLAAWFGVCAEKGYAVDGWW